MDRNVVIHQTEFEDMYLDEMIVIIYIQWGLSRK